MLPSWYPKRPGDVRGNFFREQAISLAASGVQVGVLAFIPDSVRDWGTAAPRGGDSAGIDDGVATHRRWRYNPALLLGPRAYAQRVRRQTLDMYASYVRAWGTPDVVHVHSLLWAGGAAAALADEHGVPFVVSEHSSRFASGTATPRQLELCREWADRAGGRYAVSQALAESLQEQLGLAWETMPNSVGAEFLDAPLTPVDNTGVNFLNVSLLKSNKGVDNLLTAFAAQFRGEPAKRLTIVGDGPAGPELRQLSDSLGVADQVTFTGRLDRSGILEQMAAASAVVVSSRVETFGVVVVEAMAMGRPVIATRSGGPQSIVTEDTGLLVAPDDVDELGDALGLMARSLDDYDPAAIREVCARNYGPDVLARRWQRVYAQLIGARVDKGS